MRYEVYVPSDPYESWSVCDLDEARRLLYVLADEFSYAQIRYDGKIIDDLQIL